MLKTLLICPECQFEIQDEDYVAFRTHLVRHEPYYDQTSLIKPHKCSMKCGRWIALEELEGHEKVCNGEAPFSSNIVKVIKIKEERNGIRRQKN